MLELFSLIGGGLFRLFPSILEFFKQGRDLKHEIALLDKSMELEKLKWEHKEREITATTESIVEGAWANALPYALEVKTSGIRFIDAINASVRPLLTYWWCIILYSAYKLITVAVAVNQEADLITVANLLVTEFDKAVIGSIVGFWFLDRALRKKGL